MPVMRSPRGGAVEQRCERWVDRAPKLLPCNREGLRVMTHYAGSDRAAKGKDRIESGARLSENRDQRPFFCRSCGVQVRGSNVPDGWYALTRATGQTTRPSHRLGLYCGLRCLEEMLPRLNGIAEQLGEGFADATSQFGLRKMR